MINKIGKYVNEIVIQTVICYYLVPLLISHKSITCDSTIYHSIFQYCSSYLYTQNTEQTKRKRHLFSKHYRLDKDTIFFFILSTDLEYIEKDSKMLKKRNQKYIGHVKVLHRNIKSWKLSQKELKYIIRDSKPTSRKHLEMTSIFLFYSNCMRCRKYVVVLQWFMLHDKSCWQTFTIKLV